MSFGVAGSFHPTSTTNPAAAINLTEIAENTRTCFDTFKSLRDLLQPEISKVDEEYLTAALVTNELGRFRNWSENIGARQAGSASLDYRLAEAPHVRSQVLILLRDLKYSLDEIISIASGERPQRTAADIDTETFSSDDFTTAESEADDSLFESDDGPDVDDDEDEDDEDEGPPQPELVLLFESVKETITSLFMLVITFRSVSPQDRYARSAAVIQLDSRYDIDYVYEKCPAARSSPWLVERLGEFITRRRQYFMYRQMHHRRLSTDRQFGSATVELGSFSGYSDLPLTIVRSDFGGGSRFGGEGVASSQAPTFATPYAGRDPDAEEDSEVDDTASSIASSVSSRSREVFRLPPPPAEAADENPFECPHCYEILQLKTANSWRRHLFLDLQPFICTFKECHMNVFVNKEDWFRHELETHRTRYVCHVRECRSVFVSARSLEQHLEQVHAGTYTAAQLPMLLELCKSSVTRMYAKDCPLCDAWDMRLRARMDKDAADSSDQSPQVTVKQFKNHLARHLVQLALSAMPKQANDEPEGDEPRERRRTTVQFSQKLDSDGDSTDLEEAADDDEASMAEMKSLNELKNVRASKTDLSMYLAAQGGIAVLEAALEEGKAHDIDLSQAASDGRTALHQAARDGNEAALDALHACGADLHVKDRAGATALHVACDFHRTSTAHWLVMRGADVDTRDASGSTSLHRAAAKGHTDLVGELLEHGANIEAPDAKGLTPLHRACARNHLETVELLLKSGAQVESRDLAGKTPLYPALNRDRFEAVVEVLIEAGADVNAREFKGLTPLQAAAGKGHVLVVEFLLERGADIDADGPRGIRAIHRAIYDSQPLVLFALLDAGADVNIKDADGWSAMYGAASSGNVAMAGLIMDHGRNLDIEARDNVGMSALHRAAVDGHPAMVTALALHGANIETRDADGQTPLHGAAAAGHLKVVQALIDRGADVSVEDNKGRTVFAVAPEENKDLVMALLDAQIPREVEGEVTLAKDGD